MSQRPLSATQTAVGTPQAAGDSQAITQLGDYKLISKLGEGGMGSVFLAEDTGAQRKVALKVLPLQHAENANWVSRFHREAKAIGRLNHPNIIQAYNVGEEYGYHYFAMELCDGSPLDSILHKEHRLPAGRALDIIIQAALGLQHAHAHGIIHRDMKPANLFMTSDGTVKILDLGLSKNIEDNNQSFVTHAGAILGTPHYISPEQVLGTKDIDGRTDIYSLGATFYHLVTGRTPFEGKSAAVILSKHLSDQLTNPQDINPDIPNDVVQVIQRMMAKSPDDRYQSCDELLEDLEAIRDGQALSSTALKPELSSILPRTTVLTAIESAVQSKPHHSVAESEGRPLSFYAGIVAAVVLALTITVMVARSRSASASPLAAPAPQIASPAAPAPLSSSATAGSPSSAPLGVPSVSNAGITGGAVPAVEIAKQVTHTSDEPPVMKSATAGLSSSAPANEAVASTTVDRSGPPSVSASDSSKQMTRATDGALLDKPAVAQAEAPRDVSVDVLKQTSQSLRQNHFVDAIELLDKRAKEAPAEGAAIEREKAMITALRSLRDQALDAIRKMNGKSVTLKIGSGDVTGIVTENPDHTLIWKINNGPEMTLTAGKLEASDVDHLAPKTIDGDNLKTRGFLYLVAGDLETARLYFNNAQKNGATADSVTPYLERIDALQGATKKPAARADENTVKTTSNLLRSVDPRRAVCGGWKVQNGRLTSDESENAGIEIPSAPPADYDLRIEFSRESGAGCVMVVLPWDGGQAVWVLSPNCESYLGTSAGKPNTANAPALENGKRHSVCFEVRKDHIRVFMDDKFDAGALNTVKSDVAHGPMDWLNMRGSSHIGIGSRRASVNFYTATLRDPQQKNQPNQPKPQPDRNEYPNYKR